MVSRNNATPSGIRKGWRIARLLFNYRDTTTPIPPKNFPAFGLFSA
jgi:hypothetical protein